MTTDDLEQVYQFKDFEKVNIDSENLANVNMPKRLDIKVHKLQCKRSADNLLWFCQLIKMIVFSGWQSREETLKTGERWKILVLGKSWF